MKEACRRIIGFILDPIIFLSLLAPLVISAGLQFMDGSLALHSTELGEKGKQLESLLRHGYREGLIDYVIAYFTLAAAGILWIARCFRAKLIADYIVLIEHLGSKSQKPATHNHESTRLWVSGLVFLVLTLCLGWMVLGHSIASPSMLLHYVDHANSSSATLWGKIVRFLPPFDSAITWFRGFLAIHVTFLIKPFEHQK